MSQPILTEQLMENILDIGIALSSEKDDLSLLEYILKESMTLTNCDAGTLYIKNENTLDFMIMVTKSQNVYRGGIGQEPIPLPPVPLCEENVCSYAALHNSLINIPDVYTCSTYDFSGPKKYDSMTGFRTQSMLVVPMEDSNGNILGVIQLINAMDASGTVIPFAPDYEKILRSIASQTAICMLNMKYTRQLADMFDSLVRVMSTAIDQRSPYTANHSRMMVRYASKWLEDPQLQQELQWADPLQQRRHFLNSIWLHDIGKLIIPPEVMDKADRLGHHKQELFHRMETASLLNEIDHLNGSISTDAYQTRKQALELAQDVVLRINTAGFLSEENEQQLTQIQSLTYTKNGETYPLFTPEELDCLFIRRGTLTAAERSTMESHVTLTHTFLNAMNLQNDYQQVNIWASSHHELLNGSGYPNHLSGDQIPMEVRMLTILDIFDALTAKDRPYKPPLPEEKAFSILRDMAEHGNIDAHLLQSFYNSNAWR